MSKSIRKFDTVNNSSNKQAVKLADNKRKVRKSKRYLSFDKE